MDVSVDRPAAARRAFDSGAWSRQPPRERKRVLQRFAELILAHRDELALLEPFRGAMISGMGMNPHHQHRRSNWDYVYVAAAMVVALGVLAWAFLG